MRKFYQCNRLLYMAAYKILAAFLFVVTGSFFAVAQCPANIDFEQGNFTGWECFTGSFSGGNLSLSPTLPNFNRHTMLSAMPGDGIDFYGQFPQNCPNGSGHSIRLGNAQGGGGAERVSYTFTIPSNQNTFSLIYNYAVVLQDFGHTANIQPRMNIQVMNLTDNVPDPCSSFDFVVNGSLPGFFTSRNSPANLPVRCKDWSAASINLDGHAGKTIQISFTTTDCGQTAHFGYAYIDINNQCGSSFVGATFCADDTLVNITAPFGYQNYRWFNLANTTLGTQQMLTLNPPPLSGDSVFVELTPYNGYGCVNILTAHLWDTLTVNANAGPDQAICNNTSVQLGGPPEPGRVYKWTPAMGLSNANISNPIASPSNTIQYTLTVTGSGGGCLTTDVVNVNVENLSDSIELIGTASFCTGNGLFATLKVLPADSIQWYKDDVAMPGANQTILNILQTGAYYAKVFGTSGCVNKTATKQITVNETPVAGFAVNAAVQCFAGNQFVFNNSSTISTGALQYSWDLGDGTVLSTADVTHNYLTDGTYKVKLIVTAASGCTDDSLFDVTVNPGAEAGFSINTPAQCFKNNSFVLTNKSIASSGLLQYSWDFGDGTLLTAKDALHSYILPGSYVVKLSATAAGGCKDDSLFTVTVNPSPIAGFAVNNNVQCFPGHQFVLSNSSSIFSGAMQYSWNMGDSTFNTTDVNYSYTKPGSYVVKLVADAAGGCKDSLSKDVVVHPTPSADFTIRPICENLQVPIINRTFNNSASSINYLWDFGNGHTDNVKSPVYSYPVAGTYAVKLSVSTVQCPVSIDTKSVDVTIDAVTKGIVYPDKDAAFNFPEPLQARQFGVGVTWWPSTNLNNRFSYTPTFTGLVPQLYTIQIKTATGCITVDTQLVKTHKKIEIYVPTSFTPDGNGLNERLRPVLIGFLKVNYFRIYNRWGQLLFSMNSDKPGWDGKINNTPVDMQTIVWMIEAVDVDGKVHQRQGTTVLMK
jgi:gliding motility-associated-like protein